MRPIKNDNALSHTAPRRLGQKLALAVLIALALCGCGDQKISTNMPLKHLAPVSDEGIQRLSRRTIFFGHQSVGYDIVSGMDDVLKQHPASKLQIIESKSGELAAGPAFIHAQIGTNSDPNSKIEDFARRIRGGVGDHADIAAFKFCYIDFNKDTDVSRVFEKYQATMADLSKTYPRTRFVHVTVPLKATIQGWKKHVKNMMGKPDPRIADNLKREEFNDLLRQRYSGREPLFDLAALEATRANGTACADQSGSKAVLSLVPEYTHDSGHLNEKGRRFIGERWLGWLAAL